MREQQLTGVVLALVGVMALAMAGCTASQQGVARVEQFAYPDIKQAFCGVHINYQFCKCAFHGEFCKEVVLSKSAANKEVQRQYDEWVAGQVAIFGQKCTSASGSFNKAKASCSYCSAGYRAGEAGCVAVNAVAEKSDSVLDSQCKVRAEIFDREWKKYSDIDAAIPYADRSYEAKQLYDAQEKRIALAAEGIALEREQELDKLVRAELERYRVALTKNIKVNLLKSFWRLAWVTYSTIDSGKGLGEDYAELLEGVDVAAEGIGKGLKLIQGVVPNDSALAINTESLSGKVKSVGLNTALEGLASLGDPVTTATEFFDSSANVNFPSADITEEEIAILKNQHLKKGKIDAAIVESDVRAAARAVRMDTIETEVAGLQNKITEWERKEKDRTRTELEGSCKH